uniref:Uncharacterized protein n=1 Tax=Anabas testudineus TaxID=64144 RepID=A0A7N6A434_ANATE
MWPSIHTVLLLLLAGCCRPVLPGWGLQVPQGRAPRRPDLAHGRA